MAKSLWNSTILDFFDAIFQRIFALKKCGTLQLPGALPSQEEERVAHVSSPKSSGLPRPFPSSSRTRSERVCFSSPQICREFDIEKVQHRAVRPKEILPLEIFSFNPQKVRADVPFSCLTRFCALVKIV